MSKEPVYYIEYWKTGNDLQDAIKSGKGRVLEYISMLIEEGYSIKLKKV